MDKNTIIQIIIGVIVAGLIGAISYLFTSISESKHHNDTQNIHIEYLRQSDLKQWEMFDEMTAKYIQMLMEENARIKDQKEHWRDKSYNNEYNKN